MTATEILGPIGHHESIRYDDPIDPFRCDDSHLARKRAIALSGIAWGDESVEAQEPFIRQVIDNHASRDDAPQSDRTT